jgi:hypothetical protein
LLKRRQQAVQFFIRDGGVAVDQALHGPPDEAGRAAHGQAGGRDVVDADVLHADALVQARVHAQQHAGRVGRLDEDAMDMVAKGQLQAEGHAAGAAPHAARQVDEQGMRRIDRDAACRELGFQALAGHRIAEKQIVRVFIVDEVAGRVALRLLAPFLDGHAVVGGVLHHRDAVAAQLVLLPLARVRRHVHRGAKAQASRS